MRMLTRSSTVVLLLLSTLAMALDLDEAKSRGLVGEQPDGFLGVVKATPDAVQLAEEINAKRHAAYEAIARKNGATLDQVAILAGQKAIEKTLPGTFIKTPEGKWIKK